MVIMTIVALALFGMVYNGLINHLGHRKEGFTSLLVVGGVLAILGAGALYSWESALFYLALFAAAGLPMVIGDIMRYVRARDAHIEREQKDAHANRPQ